MKCERMGSRVGVIVIGLIAMALAVCQGCGHGNVAADDGFLIADRNKAPGCAVILPESPSAVEKHAVNELCAYVEKMTGVKLPVATSRDGALRTIELVRGSADLGEDGFRLHVDGNRLLVEGGRKGVLFAVYELLEKYGGCEWLSPDCEVVPRLERFALPSNLDDRQVPAFELRDTSWYVIRTDADFASKLKMNGARPPLEEKHGKTSFGFDKMLSSCHTFHKLLPPEKYYAQHPEYFSEVKGRRLKRGGQFCLTNPEVLKIVIDKVKERIRANPTARYFGVSQNDWDGFCTCKACAALDAREGSHAGSMIAFVNKVAEAIEPEFPDVIIETLAYKYTRKPPRSLKPRHNVMPCLCTIECEFSKPFGVSAYPQNLSFAEDLKKWRRISKHLYIWDYTTNYRYYPHTFPNVLTLQGNLQFFKENGVTQMFEQGAGQGPHADFAELKAWLIAKLEWNPYQDVEPLLKRFFNGYYGAGAPLVREWFDLAHSMKRNETVDPLRIYDEVTYTNVTDAVYERGAELWEKALASVKGDPIREKNVRWGRFGVDFTRVMRYLRTPEGNPVSLSRQQPDQRRFEEMRTIARRMVPLMDEQPKVRLSEQPELNKSYERDIRDLAGRGAPCQRLGVAEVEEWRMRLSRGAREVDDTSAENGRAIRVLGDSDSWNVYFDLNRMGFDAGVKCKLRARMRVDKKAGRQGEAFWMGVYNKKLRKPSLKTFSVGTDAVADGYAWYDIGTWKPVSDDYVWFGSGRFKEGASAVNGVYLDKLELVAQEK